MRRRFLVTGATGGIGNAVLREFVARGEEVLACARPSTALAALCAELPGVIETPFDLAKPAGLWTLATSLDQLDQVDGLIHCAGVSEVASVADSSHEMWTHTMAVNVTGPAELTRAVLPALRAASGVVVFINAVADLHAVPKWSAHAASKAALRALADSLRLEEADAGVRVLSVYPGGVATDLLRKVRTQLGRPYDPNTCMSAETLARIVVGALDVPPDSMMTEIAVNPPPVRGSNSPPATPLGPRYSV